MRWFSLAIALLPTAVVAQEATCRLPDRIDVPRAERAPRGEAGRTTPITGYLLTLSWSPNYCAARRNPGERRDAMQCGGGTDNLGGGRFGWVLHGLWPQGPGKTYPAWCRPAKTVPQRVLAEHLCMSPSVQLLQRQWAKHGTCMSATPAAYFKAAAILYRAVRTPDMALLGRGTLTAGALRRAFVARNPDLTPAMLAVQSDRNGWLSEVRLCLGPRMRPQSCALALRGAADNRPIRIR